MGLGLSFIKLRYAKSLQPFIYKGTANRRNIYRDQKCAFRRLTYCIDVKK